MVKKSRSPPHFVTVRTDGNCNGQGCLEQPMVSRLSMMESREQSNSVRQQIDEAVEELRESRGESHPEFIFALTTIGNACAKNGDDEEAIRYYDQVLPLVKKREGDFHPKVADIMVSMALSMDKKHMGSASIKNLVRALEIYERARSKASCKKKKFSLWFKIMNALNQIGNVYFHQHMTDDAGEKYCEALKISKKFVNADVADNSCVSIHVADIINNIACVKAEKKEYEQSISLYNQALELQISALGEIDPAVSITLNNIGTMNCKARQYEVALKSYKQVLKMRRQIFNKDHPSIADVLIDIGIIYGKKRDYEKAGRALKEALRVAMITYGDKHPKISMIYEQLGVIARKGGDEMQSAHYFKVAQSIDDMDTFSSHHLKGY